MTGSSLTIDKIGRRQNGIAGRCSYDVTVTYHFADAAPQTSRVIFVGSDYGAPVVMVDAAFGQQFVQDWTRYGDTLNPAWIRRFFTGEH